MHLTMKLLFYLILLANLTLYSQAAVSMGVYNNESKHISSWKPVIRLYTIYTHRFPR